ncbi:hypothetical protein HAX54_022067, partial [Datura stramonium]|nr:hypothetical protein [Datura stramonium]
MVEGEKGFEVEVREAREQFCLFLRAVYSVEMLAYRDSKIEALRTNMGRLVIPDLCSLGFCRRIPGSNMPFREESELPDQEVTFSEKQTFLGKSSGHSSHADLNSKKKVKLSSLDFDAEIVMSQALMDLSGSFYHVSEECFSRRRIFPVIVSMASMAIKLPSRAFVNLSITLSPCKYKEVSPPIKYLGCPLFQGRKKVWYFTQTTTNILKKVEAWHCKLLSSGGK